MIKSCKRAIEHDVKATDTGAYSSATLGDGLLVIRAWPGKRIKKHCALTEMN